MKYVHLFLAGIVFGVAAIITIIFCIIPANIIKLFGGRNTSKKMYWAWSIFLANLVNFILNYRFHITGLENFPKDQSNVCYISNHQSVIDICAYVGKLKLKAAPIAKIEVLKIPFVGSVAKGVEAILLDRKSPKSSIKAILDGTKELKKGKSVLIFPEGTRSKTGKMGQMKAGSYKMALRAESTIVPLAIQGSRQGFEDKKGFRRYDCYINILPPISAKGLSKEEQKELPAKISSKVEEAYLTLPVMKK